jgi:heme oxygenase (biliverdin-IX-beta and delta-forming)
MNVAAVAEGRAARLKSATRAAHQRLDTRIMSADPFGDRARYGTFLKVQHAFHRDIDALYDDPALDALLPDLAGRRRFPDVTKDLADLDLRPAVADAKPAFSDAVDIPTALGWLYVAEGSNLGAAFLLKEARRLGLSEELGARHLAGATEGRGLHWRTFTAALDGVALSDAEEARVVAGAEAAFARVLGLVEALMPVARPAGA